MPVALTKRGAMIVAVETCPAAVVNASVEKVWSLLAHPSEYQRWWGADTTQIAPEGPATAGQTVHGWTTELGRR